MKKTLFIFRRDLRIEDNTGLHFALKHSERVIPAFIFTPEQIHQNAYRSDRALQFMIESLQELQEALAAHQEKLYLFEGEPHKIVERCIAELGIDSVVVNCDYTPYSTKRDQAIEALCKAKEITFHSFEDLLLHPIQETLKQDGKPYQVFTPYYRHATTLSPALPKPHPESANYQRGNISFAHTPSSLYEKILPTHSPQARGGRNQALKILDGLSSLQNYALIRDYPALQGSSLLSAHLKFGTCSAREVYYTLAQCFGLDHALIRSLYWRDFFHSIAFYFPHVFGSAFKQESLFINWHNSEALFRRWCEGSTGFPIVDAGMRELNQTGFMHNRVRMIAASFLVKDLHIDWRWGEKYFAQHLIDYDPCVNNGNWQWCASTGCDAQPYFRIFNPWNQSEKYDPECLYIKKWLPELNTLEPNKIHHWDLHHTASIPYSAPIVEHKEEAKIAVELHRCGNGCDDT